MVLNKRRPVAILPVPDSITDNTEIFMMKGTNEVFTDYEHYLKRFDWLNQKKFTDAVNGKTGLNYWDALDSEQRSAADIENIFPEPLREPILRDCQFSTVSRMDDLVNILYEKFKHNYFPGEEVLQDINGVITIGKIREKANFPMIRGHQGQIIRQPFSRYFIDDLEHPGTQGLMDETMVRRDRKVFTKANLRAFLKNSLQRDAWIGAPWLVKEHLAIEYRLPMEIPAHLFQDARLLQNKQMLQVRPLPKGRKPKGLSQDEYNQLQQQELNHLQQQPDLAQNSHRPLNPHQAPGRSESRAPLAAQLPQPPPQPKYPIEDLDIAPRRDGTTRPELKFLTQEMSDYVKSKNPATFTFSDLSMKSTGALLEIWNTLNVQAEVYVLDSFTFDDFVDAMKYSSVDMPCELFEEVHCAVLKLFLDDQGGIAVKDLPQTADDEEDDEEDEVKSEHPDVSMLSDAPARSTRSRKSLIETPADVTLSLVEDDKKVNRAVEMLGEQTWSDRLRAQDFEDGGWQVIVVGLLLQLCSSPYYKDECETILARLAPEHEPPTRETALRMYAALHPNLRIAALQTLTMLTVRTDAVKKFLEQCAEDMTDVRKRKTEFQRERKLIVEQLVAKEKERKAMEAEMDGQGVSVPASEDVKHETPDVDVTDATLDHTDNLGDDFDDSELGASGRRSLRGGNERKRKREEEHAKREKERAEKAEVMKAQTKQMKEFKKLGTEADAFRKKIVDLEANIEDCDDDLREANVQRTRVLGKDRFCNRYYWFERNGQPFAGLPRSSTASYGYANGRIWVQGPDALEREGFIERSPAEQKEYHQRFQLSVPERRTLEEGATTLPGADDWGYLDTPEQLDTLIAWLDERGDREKPLKKELQLWRERIAEFMRAHTAFFEAEEARRVEVAVEAETNGRIATRHREKEDAVLLRERCLKWHNSMALENNGAIHSRPVKAKAKRGKRSSAADAVPAVTAVAAKGVAVVVGKNGKAAGRSASGRF